MRYAWLVIVSVLMNTSQASAMYLQVGAAPLLGQAHVGDDEDLSSGLGVIASYIQPATGYTLDVIGQCMWSDHDLPSGDFIEDQRVRSCDVAAGASYRIGHPYAVKAKSRFGLALGMAVGVRQRHVCDALRRTADGIPLTREPNTTSYLWVIRPHISVTYTRRLLSFAVYATASTTQESQFGVEPSVGLLLSGRFEI